MEAAVSKTSAVIGLLAMLVVVGAVFATPANYPPCPSEDSTWCVWNGAQQGNGEGSTVVNLWEGLYFTP